MALLSSSKKLSGIRYVCRADSAIDEEKSDRERYESDPMKHADSLVYKDGQEPTVFILNFNLKIHEYSEIKNASISGVDRKSDAKLTMGSWAETVAKFCLKGIENPPDVSNPLVKFKRDGRGYVSDEVLSILAPTGVIEEIWQLYLTSREPQTEEQANLKN